MDTVTGGGLSVIVAVLVFVLSATLLAVIVRVCCVAILLGAVYSPPAVRLPIPVGLTLHVTLVFADPVTVALNCCDPLAFKDTAAGITVTDTGGGFNVIVAAALLVLSPTLVAVTLTVCCVAMLAGAV
jgi:hypothetical protein